MRDGDSDDEVAVGDGPVVARGHDQVLAALATIGSRPAHVDDEPEPRVVDGVGPATGRDLDDRRTVALEVEDARHVDGVGVPGQEQRSRVQQMVQDADLVARRDADLLHPHAHRLQRRRRHAVEEHLDTTQEVEVVEEEVGGRPVGKPSANSSVPIRVSTRSGVRILAGTGVL